MRSHILRAQRCIPMILCYIARRMMNPFKKITLSLLATLIRTTLLAQEQPALNFPLVVLPNTEVRVLHSQITEVDYKLYVSLPPSYDTSAQRYPVVYLLDADYSFALAKNICEHIAARRQLPELLLVAIAYDGPPNYRLHRTRDYTPTRTLAGGYGPEYQQHSGGGEKFRDFLREELLPFIARNYRVTHERTFVGHSYGGLFGAWLAFTTPELFAHYILVSPSLWYDEHLLFRLEKEFATRQDTLPLKLHLSVGAREINAERNMVADLQKFAAQIESRNYKGLKLRWHVFEDETHNSVFPSGFTKGIRFIYEN